MKLHTSFCTASFNTLAFTPCRNMCKLTSENAMSKSSVADYNVGSIKYNNKWVFFDPSI